MIEFLKNWWPVLWPISLVLVGIIASWIGESKGYWRGYETGEFITKRNLGSK